MKQEILNFAVQIINNSSTKEEAEINIENYCDYLKENFLFEDKNFIPSIKNLLNFYETKKLRLKDKHFYLINGYEKAPEHMAYMSETPPKRSQVAISSCDYPPRTRC